MLRIYLLLILFSPALASAATEKIGDGLYAYISSNDSSSNSVFLVGDNGILVVDTGLNAHEGQNLLDEIRRISTQPVRWIVNTHYHPDHRGGNAAVGPNATILTTAYTREQVLRGASKNSAPDYALNQIVDKEGMILYIGGHPAVIYAVGPAHTRGDLVVYFPDQHSLATGDLFLNNSCPYMDDGEMDNWIVALDQMISLPVEHVVPGHFELAGWIELQHFRDYLEALRTQVSRLHAQGVSLSDVQHRLDLRAFQGFRQFPKYEATFADNAAVYYRQLERRAHKNQF